MKGSSVHLFASESADHLLLLFIFIIFTATLLSHSLLFLSGSLGTLEWVIKDTRV